VEASGGSDAGAGIEPPDTRIMISADLQGFYVARAFSVGLGRVGWGHFCRVGDRVWDRMVFVCKLARKRCESTDPIGLARARQLGRDTSRRLASADARRRSARGLMAPRAPTSEIQ
jgi:hypothetical protein